MRGRLLNRLTIVSLALFLATMVLAERSLFFSDVWEREVCDRPRRTHGRDVVQLRPGLVRYTWDRTTAAERCFHYRLPINTWQHSERRHDVPWRRFERLIPTYDQVSPGACTASVPFVLLLPLTGVLPALALRRSLRRTGLAKRGLCPSCAYDLRGNVTGVCPECGTAASNV